MAILNFKLSSIFKSKMFWIGVVIRITITLYLFSLHEDLNDMNGLLIYAIQRLFNGENPYDLNYEYQLSVHGVDYNYYLGYPPVLLFVYAIVIIYPEMWGITDFNILVFSLNVLFDFLCVYILYEKDHRFGNITMGVYWCVPFFPYSDLVSFYSALFLLCFISMKHLDDPLKSSMLMFLCIGSYHLFIFMMPVILVYYFRTYISDDEALKIYIEQFKGHGNKKFKTSECLKRSFSLVVISNALKRGFKDLKVKGLTILKKIIIGILPTILIFIPFIVWDFDGLKYHLIEASADRYNIGEGTIFAKILLILLFTFVVFAVLIQFTIEKRYLARVWVNAANSLIFFLLATYLYVSLGFNYPHYYVLLVPSGFYLMLNIVYDFREFRLLRNKTIPGLRNEKLAQKFKFIYTQQQKELIN